MKIPPWSMDTSRIRNAENDNERILDYTVEQRDFFAVRMEGLA